jgi:hypothetical protein
MSFNKEFPNPSYAAEKIPAGLCGGEAAWRGRGGGCGLKIACSEDLAYCGLAEDVVLYPSVGGLTGATDVFTTMRAA